MLSFNMYCVKGVLLSQPSIHILFSKANFNKEIHLLCLLPKKLINKFDKLREPHHAEKSKIIAQNNRTLQPIQQYRRKISQAREHSYRITLNPKKYSTSACPYLYSNIKISKPNIVAKCCSLFTYHIYFRSLFFTHLLTFTLSWKAAKCKLKQLVVYTQSVEYNNFVV